MKTTTDSAGRFARVETANDSKDDFFEIEIGGRAARVFRPVKNGERLESYYIKGTLAGGKQFYRSTGFSKKTDARDAARRLWKAAIEKRFDALDETKLRQDHPTPLIGEIIAAYEERIRDFNLTIEPSVIAANVGHLRRVCAYALELFIEVDGAQRKHIDKARVDALKLTALNEELVEKFFAAYVRTAGRDRLARDTRIRGAVSTLRQARAVFSERAMKCYRGMTMPELKGFMSAVGEEPKAPLQVHIETSTMRAIATAALALRASNPALYLAHLCFRHLGMRNDEIENARVEWIERRPQTVFLPNGEKREIGGFMVIKTRAYWEPKQSEGEIPIAPEVLAEIEQLIAGRAPGDALIDAPHKTAREDLINREHADFVRPWTSTSRKKSYELRRWSATVAAERQGEEFAERFLRHKSKSVAGKFYVTRRTPPAPITFADCGLDAKIVSIAA